MQSVSRGDKIFQGVQINQKFLFRGSKYFNKIEINNLGIQIFQLFGLGELIMGVHFLHDRPANKARPVKTGKHNLHNHSV